MESGDGSRNGGRRYYGIVMSLSMVCLIKKRIVLNDYDEKVIVKVRK